MRLRAIITPDTANLPSYSSEDIIKRQGLYSCEVGGGFRYDTYYVLISEQSAPLLIDKGLWVSTFFPYAPMWKGVVFKEVLGRKVTLEAIQDTKS